MIDTIFYVFAGRRQNLEIQMPLVRRVLDEHPNVRFDVWNLTRLYKDEEYVHRIRGDRIAVRHDYYKYKPWWRRFDYVWKHYTRPEYEGTQFVKIDDDVIFFETDRFGEFVEQSIKAPGVISSALTINNGASVAHTPGMQAVFDKLDIPLLDVHESGEFADACHTYAINNLWEGELLDMPVKAIPTRDWLSINMIAYDYATGCQVSSLIGKSTPEEIAGRCFNRTGFIGDEGACNIVRRQIIQGFLAAHLTFGPQELPKERWEELRGYWADAGRAYLES